MGSKKKTVKRAKKIKIGFDLDGVIIDKPPIITKSLLERLVRSSKNKHLAYRYPKYGFERWVRWVSHHPLFRPPIKENVEIIENLCDDGKCELYVVTSRYAFLKDRTKQWFDTYNMDHHFKKIIINEGNEQPHIFKERLINNLGLKVYIDDDPLIVKYLQKKLRGVEIILAEKNIDKVEDLV